MASFAFTPPLDQDFTVRGVISQPWMGFFTSVSVEKKQWSPVVVGVSGASGTWTRFGPNVRLFVRFAGVSTASGASLTLPFRCIDAASAQFWSAGAHIGDGFIAAGTLTFPNWTSLTDVVLFGEYPLENK